MVVSNIWVMVHVAESWCMLLSHGACCWVMVHVAESWCMLLSHGACCWVMVHVAESWCMLLSHGACYPNESWSSSISTCTMTQTQSHMYRDSDIAHGHDSFSESWCMLLWVALCYSHWEYVTYLNESWSCHISEWVMVHVAESWCMMLWVALCYSHRCDTDVTESCHICENTQIWEYTNLRIHKSENTQIWEYTYILRSPRYGVALVSRIDKIIGLFCKRAL